MVHSQSTLQFAHNLDLGSDWAVTLKKIMGFNPKVQPINMGL